MWVCWGRPDSDVGSVAVTYALVLVSAVAHALAFPPWNFTAVAWVALVPLLIALRALRPGTAALAGLLWGSTAIWGVAYWVPGAIAFYYEQPWWFGVLFGVVGSMVLWGSYYAAFAALTAWLIPRTRGLMRAGTIAAAWIVCELARAKLLTGEPWMLLGYALVPHLRLIQIADLGGVYALSALVLFVNVSVDAVLLDGRSAAGTAAVATALLVAALAYGTIRLSTDFHTAPPVRVAVVQGNNDLGAQWNAEHYGRGLDTYLRLSREAVRKTRAAVLLWPESAVTFFLPEEADLRIAVERLVAETDTEVVLGGPHLDGADPAAPRFFNSAFALAPGLGITGRYDKTHLLPFAEYFPLRFSEFLRRRFERVRVFTAGNDPRLLPTRLGPTAVAICFEAIFPELVRTRMAAGAAVLLNLSNDGWLGAGAAQHAAMVTLRGVENRTWVVRATATGISGVIDPHGRWTVRSGTGTAAILAADVVPLHADAVYKRYGDVFAHACVVAVCVAAAVVALRDRPSAEDPV